MNPNTPMITSTLKKLLLTLLAGTALLAFTGCKNTAEGVGQDVERAGEKIQEKVN